MFREHHRFIFVGAFVFIIALLGSHRLFAATNVIDVLVVYTPGVSSAYGGDPSTRINQLFQISNQIYIDSGVNAELRLAKAIQVNYTDDNTLDIALNDLTYASNAAFSTVATERAAAMADMVLLYRPYKSIQGGCGLAWINGIGTNGVFNPNNVKPYMMATVGINTCGDYVTAHELGHNMGLRHSRRQDTTGGTFPYALGYGVDGVFVDMMAYQSSFGVDYWTGKVYKFSSPNLVCMNLPCGIDRTDTVNGADAAYTLNVTVPQVANLLGASSSSSSATPVSATTSSTTTTTRKRTTGKDEFDALTAELALQHKQTNELFDQLDSERNQLQEHMSNLQKRKADYNSTMGKLLAKMQELNQQQKQINQLRHAVNDSREAEQLNQLEKVFNGQQERVRSLYRDTQEAQSHLATATSTTQAALTKTNETAQQYQEAKARMNRTQTELQNVLANLQQALRENH